MTQAMICPRRLESAAAAQFPEPDSWRDDNTCSYCGGLNPDEVIKLLEVGSEVTPTDKNYKMYISDNRKVYFQHFEDSHRGKLIDLHNARKIKFAAPGYFYVRPFFTSQVK